MWRGICRRRSRTSSPPGDPPGAARYPLDLSPSSLVAPLYARRQEGSWGRARDVRAQTTRSLGARARLAFAAGSVRPVRHRILGRRQDDIPPSSPAVRARAGENRSFGSRPRILTEAGSVPTPPMFGRHQGMSWGPCRDGGVRIPPARSPIRRCRVPAPWCGWSGGRQRARVIERRPSEARCLRAEIGALPHDPSCLRAYRGVARGRAALAAVRHTERDAQRRARGAQQRRPAPRARS